MCWCSSQIAVIITILIITIFYIIYNSDDCSSDNHKDDFTQSQTQEVYMTSKELFNKNGGATFSEFKQKLKDADAVSYTDIRNLWKGNNLTKSAVAKVI